MLRNLFLEGVDTSVLELHDISIYECFSRRNNKICQHCENAVHSIIAVWLMTVWGEKPAGVPALCQNLHQYFSVP